MTELWYLDGVAQADLVRRREVSALELVDAAIDRIERIDPQLNAVVTPLFDAEREVAWGPLPDKPLAGVPFLVKDLGCAQAGVRQTNGSRAMRGYVPAAQLESARPWADQWPRSRLPRHRTASLESADG